MKNLLNVNLPIKKTSSLGFVAMLLFTIAIVTMPANAATVPAQSMFIDPTYPDPAVTNLTIGDTFTVDAMVNATAPTSPGGTGMFGFEYKLFWNSTYVNVTSYTTHIPAAWEPPAIGFLVRNETGVWLGGPRDGLWYHWHAFTTLTGTPYTGNMSLCTYNFNVTDQPSYPDPAFSGTLALQDVKIVDDTATTFITDTPPPAGTIQNGTYYVSTTMRPLANFTWSPETPEVGELATFDGSLSTPNGGSIEFYAWNFSDGTSIVNETDPITTHTYAAIGIYDVTLTVTDSEGITNSTTKSVTVQDTTPPTIEDPSRTPSGDVLPDEDVRVSVNVTDAGTGVKNVTLSYTITNGTSWTDIEMIYDPISELYNATIPGQPAFTWVKFNITAYDNEENPATRDGAGVNFVYKVVPEFPAALIVPLFMIISLIAVILGKRRARNREHLH
jgi:PKD repeat protein